MKRIFYLILPVILFSCKTTEKTTNIDKGEPPLTQQESTYTLLTASQEGNWKFILYANNYVKFIKNEAEVIVDSLEAFPVGDYQSVSQDGGNLTYIVTEEPDLLSFTIFGEKCRSLDDVELDRKIEIKVFDELFEACIDGGDLYFDKNDRWELQSLSEASESSLLNMNTTPFVIIDDSSHTIVGSTGCNSFNGSFYYKGDEGSFENLSSTKAGCKGKQIENLFLESLQQVTRFERRDLRLFLYSGNDLLMTFKKN